MIFAKTYELSLTRNYVSKWGMAQAVRELLQNALDSESPFVYRFEPTGVDDGSQSLFLTSEFTTLLPQTLLLGATSKADAKDSIGSFGEGYKIALLVLTRLGYAVDIMNGGLLWRPRFRFNKKFGEELLTVEETDLPDKTNKGLTFAVQGLTEEDVAEVRASCLQMQDTVGQIKATPMGDILLERPGMLYVGGLFVCKTEMHYGYNMKPDRLKLERDRETVNSWDLGSLTKDMWFATCEYDAIAKMISEEVPDLAYAEYSSPELVKEACFRLFQERNPGAVVAANQAELKALVERGMVRTVVESRNYAANIRGSESYRNLPNIHVKSPHQRLTEWYSEAKFHMHDSIKESFRALLEDSKGWKL